MKKSIVALGAFALFAISSVASAAAVTLNSGPTVDLDVSDSTLLVSSGLNSTTITSAVYTFSTNVDTNSFISLTENLTDSDPNSSTYAAYADFASMTLDITDGVNTWSWTTPASSAGDYDSIVTSLSLAAGTIYTATITGTFWNPPTTGSFNFKVSAVPVPAALLLFGPALLGMMAMSRRRKMSKAA